MLEVTVVVPEGAEPETVSGREAQVCIGIASDAWQWPGGPFERRAVASLVGRRASARFDELVPGHYAIVAFLDLDGDAELDRGAFGMPLEPIAYGNDAEPKLGPPPFKSCLVEVPESGAAAVMLLRVR